MEWRVRSVRGLLAERPDRAPVNREKNHVFDILIHDLSPLELSPWTPADGVAVVHGSTL